LAAFQLAHSNPVTEESGWTYCYFSPQLRSEFNPLPIQEDSQPLAFPLCGVHGFTGLPHRLYLSMEQTFVIRQELSVQKIRTY